MGRAMAELGRIAKKIYPPSTDTNSACPSARPLNFTRCAIQTAKTQRPTPCRACSFRYHSDPELFRSGRTMLDSALARTVRARSAGPPLHPCETAIIPRTVWRS